MPPDERCERPPDPPGSLPRTEQAPLHSPVSRSVPDADPFAGVDDEEYGGGWEGGDKFIFGLFGQRIKWVNFVPPD